MDSDTFSSVFAVVFWLVIKGLFGWWASTVGVRKGRDPYRWFFVGFLLGWIGVILAYCFGDLNAKPIATDELDAG